MVQRRKNSENCASNSSNRSSHSYQSSLRFGPLTELNPKEKSGNCHYTTYLIASNFRYCFPFHVLRLTRSILNTHFWLVCHGIQQMYPPRLPKKRTVGRNGLLSM